MASIINTGVSALNAFKRQMETTGHNIANVNTEGYSRQTVELGTRQPQMTGQGYVGSGVDAASIHRAYDDFLATRVRDYTSSYEESSVYEQRAMQIDNVIADASAGIDDMMQQFFASVNDVASDPTSIAARAVMLNRATQLNDRFNALDGWFGNLRTQVNRDVDSQVGEINSLAQSLAEVNSRIGSLNGGIGGVPNDILDERDRLVDQLSHYTNVSAMQQSDGSMNVFIGTGQALVVGGHHNTLAVAQNPYDAEQKELVVQQFSGPTVNVTAQMSGGSLGGLMRFRDEVLDEAQNGLGRVAIGMASFFNEEHQTGMDLDGELGGDFFSLAAPQALGRQGNSAGSSATLAIEDASQLTTHNYRLDNVAGAWSMTDLETGGNVPLSVTAGPPDRIIAAAPADLGFSVLASGVAGDSFLLRPTRNGASGIGLLVSNERDIAAAEAVRAADVSGNTGTGHIGAGALTARAAPGVAAAPAFSVSLTYNAANELVPPGGTQFVDVDGNPIAGNLPYVMGQNYRLEIAGLGVFDFTMTGTPNAGDTFIIQDNIGGVGDNRNARRLADLQTAKLMIGGTATIASTYGTLIADVGTKTHQAGSNASVQKNLLVQAESAKSEVSGVNLDEEAADLVRFQQAYQAAAQVISIANSLFESLLGAVRR
ncbi:MAG: flagellar hook-associated protein FlgK [Chromatiaceae bacterium]|nr:flagellar hook-associated protein FlgK [Chromatiaceae bacterium]